MAPLLAYYSSTSENTHSFVNKLWGLSYKQLYRITKESYKQLIKEPYILIVPTYADGYGVGALHKYVIKFLNIEANRKLLRGVIGSGNRNFGSMYALGGKIVSAKCKVPLLYTFELRGTEDDIENVSGILNDKRILI